MKPSVKTLGEILYAPSQYVIPVFHARFSKPSNVPADTKSLLT
jgi:hypothetical protein